ncbi:MAG: serine/threonine-protein kinase [Polyangiaceae bacterium]
MRRLVALVAVFIALAAIRALGVDDGVAFAVAALSAGVLFVWRWRGRHRSTLPPRPPHRLAEGTPDFGHAPVDVAPATPPAREGDVVAGRYRIGKVVRPTQSPIVAAHDLTLDRQVAIYLPSVRLVSGDDRETASRRFVREGEVIQRILAKCERLPKVFEVGRLPDGAPYMVTEVLDGETLAQWLPGRAPLPVEQAVDFVRQASLALAEVHAFGVVHRALSPDSLLRSRRSDGTFVIRVLDLTVPAPLHADMGSPLYLSPEQMRSSRDVDAATDIWALGVILFELLTGRTPFVGDTFADLALKIISAEPPASLRAFRLDVPAGLEAVVVKCLQKDRTARYRDAGELASALRPFGPGGREGQPTA